MKCLNAISHLLNPFSDHSYGKKMVSGVSTDSRSVQPRNLFFPIKGARTDGHHFLDEAIARGAIAAVVNKQYAEMASSIPLIPVDDVLEALQKLAKEWVKECNPKVVSITGSVGKTTAKEFLTQLLKNKFTVTSSPGNSNSQVGLPLAILNNLTAATEILVLEMGMTHPGNIENLVQIAPPDVAIITSVALVHACNFNSIEEIAKAKAEIFSHPKTHLGIYHEESNYHGILKNTGKSLKYSFSLKSDRATYQSEQRGGKLLLKKNNESLMEFLPLDLPGEHNIQNFFLSAIAANHLGLSWEEIRYFQGCLKLPEKRLQIMNIQGVQFVNDSYNASEISTKAALSSLPNPKEDGKKIAVLGEMRELGRFSQQCHQAVAEHALSCVDTMLCLGSGCAPIYECWKSAGREVEWRNTRAEILDVLRTKVAPGDVVLLKGSNSNELWKILDEI